MLKYVAESHSVSNDPCRRPHGPSSAVCLAQSNQARPLYASCAFDIRNAIGLFLGINALDIDLSPFPWVRVRTDAGGAVAKVEAFMKV